MQFEGCFITGLPIWRDAILTLRGERIVVIALDLFQFPLFLHFFQYLSDTTIFLRNYDLNAKNLN